MLTVTDSKKFMLTFVLKNPRPAWDPSQCSKRSGSVCRCCCGFNGCNGNEQTACKQSYGDLTLLIFSKK